MAYKIEEIEGIGAVYGKKLGEAGIRTTDDLLDACASAKGREAVAGRTGLSAAQLLKWANMADLMRLPGIGSEFSELLEAAGVDTVKELRHRVPENLHAKMAEANAARKLTRRDPALSEVQKWIEHAKTTEPKITH